DYAEGHSDGWPFCIGAEKNAGCAAGAAYPGYSCLAVLLLHPLHPKISQALDIMNLQSCDVKIKRHITGYSNNMPVYHYFFRSMSGSIAKQHNLCDLFMLKPFDQNQIQL